MKKNLLVLALSAVFGSISAYSIDIKNKSDYVLKVSMWFGGPGICGEKQIVIQPQSSRNYQTDACCLSSLRVQTIEYNGAGDGAVGKWSDAQGRLTGFGLSCRDNSFKVYVSANGTITIENN